MKLLHKFRSLFRKEKLDIEMAEELRHHVELQTELNIKAGMNSDEARYAALRQFGNVASIQERAREVRNWVWLEQCWQDVRYAFRGFARSPVFTAIAVLSLAIGIGVNTAIFSVLDAALLRTLPVPRPKELRIVNWTGRNLRAGYYVGNASAGTGSVFSYPVYREFSEHSAGLAEVFAFSATSASTVAKGRADSAEILLASGNFFAGYGVSPVMGRAFTPSDDRPGAAPVVVITHRWWGQHFAFDPDVLGQSVTINQRDFTIVGVLPREFVGPLVRDPTELYVPMSAQPVLVPDHPLGAAGHWWLQIMMRLAPGASEGQAQASLDVLFRQALQASGTKIVEPGISLEDGSRGPLETRRQMAGLLRILMVAVGVVMLVACANLAGLLLARSAARRHELALRVALGAGRWRLIRQSLIESLLLALGGGAGGLLLGTWGQRVIGVLLPSGMLDENLVLRTDAHVLLFALAAALTTALLFGLLPAIQSSRIGPLDGLKSRSGGGAPPLGSGRRLVAMQAAFSALLLVLAGLLGQTFANLNRADPGFNPTNVLLFQVKPGQAGYKGQAGVQVIENIRRSIATIPGVQAVAFSDEALVGGASHGSGLSIPGRPKNAGDRLPPQAKQKVVSDEFFRTMEIPLLLGREFNANDTAGRPAVVIINDCFARTYFEDLNPIGRTVVIVNDPHEVVGVCANAKNAAMNEEARPLMYLAHRQRRPGVVFFEIRTPLSPAALMPVVRKALTAIDPGLPITAVFTQHEAIQRALAPHRMFALLIGSLSSLAVLLSCIGLYGLLAYTVTRRTTEIGVRLALGARPQDVARSIVREALMLVAAGSAVGVPAAVALAMAARSLLFGIPPHDPLTIVGSGAVMLTAAALAAWFPARRAAKVDPMIALRAE